MSYNKIFIDGIMHMGDMIMTASVLPVIRKNCPNAKITYLCSANLAFVAELLDGVDEVIPYKYVSGGGYKDVFILGRKLAKRHFDLGISLDPRERVTLMKWFARIPERISMEQGLGWKLGWEKWFYTRDLKLPIGWKYQENSMTRTFQQMMRKFFHDTSTEFIPPRFKPSLPKNEKWVENILNSVPKNRKKVALCIQTASLTKNWPIENFIQVCDWLIENYGAQLYLTGIEAHKARGEKLLKGMKHPDSVVDLIGNTSFLELSALLSHMDLMLTLDTGSSHVAAAAGCPVVTIFTFTSSVIYRAPGKHCVGVSGHLPCSGKHICIGPSRCPKSDCVDAVTVPMVEAAIKKLFQETA
jgi:ADP-heptose:LPS heptosyltransferase